MLQCIAINILNGRYEDRSDVLHGQTLKADLPCKDTDSLTSASQEQFSPPSRPQPLALFWGTYCGPLAIARREAPIQKRRGHHADESASMQLGFATQEEGKAPSNVKSRPRSHA